MANPPSWLAALANEVAKHLDAVGVMPPLGCHFYFNDLIEQWEITLFPSNTEIVGGELDGRLTTPKLTINLRGVLAVFPDADDFHWQADTLGPDDELGPHIALQGEYRNHRIWLRILAQAPAGFDAGMYAKAYEMRVEDIW